ncbi:MAG TPA: hypothetical protein VGA00_14550 [Acidiferrobacterales bacterium]
MVTRQLRFAPGLAFAALLGLAMLSVQAAGPSPAPGTSVQSAPVSVDSAALAQTYSVTIRGRVTDTRGKGIAGAQIHWAHALQATPTDPCADPEAARGNPDCGGGLPRLSGSLGESIQSRLAEAQQAAAGGASGPTCSVDRRQIESRAPLATTGADGTYRITLRYRGAVEACSQKVSAASLRDFPALAVKKPGYSFRRNKGGVSPGALGGGK